MYFINVVFVLHALLALAISFALLFFAKPFTLAVMNGFTWPPHPSMEEKVLWAYADLTACGLLLIAIVIGAALASGYSSARWVALRAMVALGLVFVAVSFLLQVQPLAALVFWINLVLVVLYVWVWFFQRDTV